MSAEMSEPIIPELNLEEESDSESSDGWEEYNENDPQTQAAVNSAIERNKTEAVKDRVENQKQEQLEQQNLAMFVTMIVGFSIMIVYFATSYIRRRREDRETKAKLDQIRQLPNFANILRQAAA